jgi:outer membrane murein-binding lipoprotein Lpp
MTDSKKPPSFSPPPSRKQRMQSQTERDHEGFAAKKERESAVPEVRFPEEEITGKLQGEELAQARERRPTDERIGRLEQKHDQLASEVGGVRVAVATMAGKLEVLPELVKVVKDSAERAADREHVRFTAQVDIDKAQAEDVIDARRVRRRAVAKVVAGMLGGAGFIELLRLILEAR